MEIITVKGLHFQYEKEPVLKDVNFQISHGEFICMTGANGSGKSTLLKLLLNLIKPTAGYLEVKTTNIAYLAQRATAFNPDFPATAAEIVDLGFPQGKWLSSRERRQRIDKALWQMDLLNYRNKSIGRLSGGQQQRVLLAKALVRNPKLILLDEPTVGIDNDAATRICCLLGALNKREGTTLLVVTHDVPLILDHADRILQFKNGGVHIQLPKAWLNTTA